MSARRRSQTDPELNFRAEAKPDFTIERAAEIVAAYRADPATLNSLDASERVGLLRAYLVAAQALMRPGVVNGLGKPAEAKQAGKVGRPKGEGSKWLAEYEFDAEHLQAFREAGWANVPPDKTAFCALLDRTGKSENTLKVSLRRARKERRK